MKKVLVLNGPNLNMLGFRPKKHYGECSLEDINQHILEMNKGHFDVEFFQSNSEGELVTKIQQAMDCYAILINPAAYTHTSIAIRDALELCQGIKIEIHLSKVDERESFRRINYVRDICDICFSGKQEGSYYDAFSYLLEKEEK